MVTGKPLIRVVAEMEYEPVHEFRGMKSGRVRLCEKLAGIVNGMEAISDFVHGVDAWNWIITG